MHTNVEGSSPYKRNCARGSSVAYCALVQRAIGQEKGGHFASHQHSLSWTETHFPSRGINLLSEACSVCVIVHSEEPGQRVGWLQSLCLGRSGGSGCAGDGGFWDNNYCNMQQIWNSLVLKTHNYFIPILTYFDYSFI